MDMVSTKQIRNICLLGHGSAGKTSVAEAMLSRNRRRGKYRT